MIHFDTRLKLTKEVIQSPNLTGMLSEEDLTKLGHMVKDGYQRDEDSRDKWRKRTQASMDLALQMQKDKNFPWPGASNVAFPLVTIATLQFHSRAYPAIVGGPEIVKCRVVGADPQGQERDRADRIGRHMSWQVLEEDTSWEEQQDRLLINVPVVGCAFKKTYHSGRKGHNVSELVLAQDLVMDYFAKSVQDCARKTHVIPMYRNEIYENVMSGIFSDVLEEPWYKSNARPMRNEVSDKTDHRQGTDESMSDEDTPFTTLEQHLLLDLDGDGYKEPYICTIEYHSCRVMRLVTRFDREDDIKRNSRGQIIKIEPTEYFTKYGFIPSPDGGIYDIGYGVLLGPLNESVNSILNQLVDAGTMANTAGGFLGRGAKIRGGQYTFAPLEWKRVDSTGDDLKKSIYPLPVREPSGVLFQLLTLLIEYTNKISGSTDIMTGENPGQNTKVGTTDAMVEQGMKIYNAIYKRIWRSMKEEFKKLYRLNSIFLPVVSAFGEAGGKILREDYTGDANRIIPAADPNTTSEKQRLQQAMTLKQIAATTNGYNPVEVEKNLLRAMRVDGWESLYPGPDKVPPLSNPKVQIEQMKTEVKKMQVQAQMQQFVMGLQEQVRLNDAKILQLQAQAAKLLEEAGGVKTGHEIAAFEAAIGAMKSHNDALMGQANTFLKAMELEHDQSQANSGARVQ